jgi:DNA-binding MarR family transcriptional regulator
MSHPSAPSSGATSVRIEHDPAHQCVRVLSSFDQGDFVEVRHQKSAPLHFDRFVQLSAAADLRHALLGLPLAQLRVFLALLLTVDRDNQATLTPAALAEATGLALAVVSRALTALHARDLLRATGRQRAGRTWMVSPGAVFRAPARLSDTVTNRWASLPRAADED